MRYFNVYRNLKRWPSNITIQAALGCGTKGFLLAARGSQRAEEPRRLSPQALVAWVWPAELDSKCTHMVPALIRGMVELLLVPICQERKQGLKWLTLMLPATLPLK